MRRVVFTLIAGLATVALAWWLASLPGNVTIGIASLTLETRTGIALLLGGAALLVLVVLLRLLLLLFDLPARFRRWRQARRRAKGDASVTAALVALAAADAPAARAAARRARDLLGDSPQTLLLDAEANRLAGRQGDAEAIYRRMEERPDSAFLGLRGLFRQALAREDWDEAAALAKRAEAAYPGALWLRAERVALAARRADWQLAQRLADGEAPRLAFATAAALAAPPSEALSLAKRAWKQDRGFAPAALAYATALRDAGKESRAQAVLAEAWALAPNPALADLALAVVPDALGRVTAATRLVAGAASHGESHFLLARTSLAAGLTGEARRHLQATRAAGLDQRRTWLMLAEVDAREQPGNDTAQRDALRHAAEAGPDPAWHCDSCGASHAAWHPACPACGAPATLRWGLPLRPALEPPAAS